MHDRPEHQRGPTHQGMEMHLQAARGCLTAAAGGLGVLLPRSGKAGRQEELEAFLPAWHRVSTPEMSCSGYEMHWTSLIMCRQRDWGDMKELCWQRYHARPLRHDGRPTASCAFCAQQLLGTTPYYPLLCAAVHMAATLYTALHQQGRRAAACMYQSPPPALAATLSCQPPLPSPLPLFLPRHPAPCWRPALELLQMQHWSS